MGFAIVAEDENGFLLETYDAIAGRPTGKTELRLDHNISNSYLKVDPANPFGPPRFEITCSQCMETVIGYSSADGEAVEWTSDCGEKRQQRVARTVYLGDDETEEYEDFEYSGLCKACMADPSRTSRTRRLREYAARRYKEESLDVTTSNFCAFSQKRIGGLD